VSVNPDKVRITFVELLEKLHVEVAQINLRNCNVAPDTPLNIPVPLVPRLLAVVIVPVPNELHVFTPVALSNAVNAVPAAHVFVRSLKLDPRLTLFAD